MSFLSLRFAAFFAVLLVLHALAPRKFKPGVLLAGSLVFYGGFGPRFLALLIIQILAAFGFGLAIDGAAARPRKRLFLAGVVAVSAPLFVFKGLPFVLQSVAELLRTTADGRPVSLVRLALPVGISFYTFKSLSYLIDVFRRSIPATRDPVRLGAAIAFFPQILAGPIERPARFLPQLEAPGAFDAAGLAAGAKLVAWGVFKKAVIADQLARYVGPVFFRPSDYAGLGLVFGLVFFAFQIYCDFSGYSDIASGLARALGFRSPDNFRYPYFSRSIAEFWTRWHITLSFWLRDYLFLPISSAVSRKLRAERILGIRTDYIVYGVGMGTTMLLCGLWHGPQAPFVLWGAIHGAYLILSRATKKARARALRRLGIPKDARFLEAGRLVFTFSLVAFAWVFFRSPTLAKAWEFLGHISLRLPRAGFGQLRFCAALLLVFLIVEGLGRRNEERGAFRRVPPVLQLALYGLFLALMIVFAADAGNEFLYLKF